MKNYFLIAFLSTVLSIPFFWQQIEYKLPEDVEDILYDKICMLSENNAGNIYAHLDHEDNGLFRIYLSLNNKDSGIIHDLINSTHRVLIIKEYVIPLIFDYDLRFCSANQAKGIGTFGNRDDKILKTALLYHGDIIHFSKNGIIRKTTF